MSHHYIIIVIICMGLVTWGLRAAPFLFMEFFKHHPVIRYLGERLPGAVMCILVIYSVKDVPYNHYPFGLPALISIAAVAILHLWKRSMFISIVFGVAIYGILQAIM